VPAQTVGASRDDLRLAERRGQESLPFPVLPGYRPMHCPLWERLTPSPTSQPRRTLNRCTSSERLHSGRGGVAESKIQPLLRDQCLAGQFGPLRQNVRAIPGAVLAWLAAHGFQPDLVRKSHWTAVKVGVRAHGAWDHEVFTRDFGWPVFQCVAVPLVAQKSEMAVSPDRVADGHKSFIPERFDCVPCLLFNPRGFLADDQERFRMMATGPLHARCGEPQSLPARSDNDGCRTGLDPRTDDRGQQAGSPKPRTFDGASHLFPEDRSQTGLARASDIDQGFLASPQVPQDQASDPPSLSRHIARFNAYLAVCNDGLAPFLLGRPHRSPLQDHVIEIARIVLAAEKMLEQPPLHATCWEWRNCRHASFSAAAAALSA